MERGCNNQSLRVNSTGSRNVLEMVNSLESKLSRIQFALRICTAIELIDFMVSLTPQKCTRMVLVTRNITAQSLPIKTKSVYTVSVFSATFGLISSRHTHTHTNHRIVYNLQNASKNLEMNKLGSHKLSLANNTSAKCEIYDL